MEEAYARQPDGNKWWLAKNAIYYYEEAGHPGLAKALKVRVIQDLAVDDLLIAVLRCAGAPFAHRTPDVYAPEANPRRTETVITSSSICTRELRRARRISQLQLSFASRLCRSPNRE